MNNKTLPQWSRYGLLLIVSLCFMDDCVAARRNKRHIQLNPRTLLNKLKERDAIIADLLARVKALENSNSAGLTQPETQANSQVSPPLPNTETTAQANTAENQTKTPAAETEAPGQFKVDLQASQRALERTLAKTGVLLLPAWYLDSDLNFSYTRRDFPTYTPSTNVQGETLSLTTGKTRQNIFTPSIAFRLGLPFDTQLEFNLPYQFINQSSVSPPLVGESRLNGSGIGDVQVGLAKTLLRETQWWPDLVARVTWNTGSGSGNLSSGNVALGGGIESISGSLSALKRQDPLAFFLNASYTKAFTANNYIVSNASSLSYNPGDTLGFSFGAQLAASAQTSLSFALSQLFIGNQTQGSQTIAGSTRNIGILSIGASSIINRNVFVTLSVGMGLTSDSPDYTAGITFSTRNNLKPYLGFE